MQLEITTLVTKHTSGSIWLPLRHPYMLLCPHAGEQQHQGEGGTRGGCGNTLKALLLQPPEGTLAATACSAEPCSSQSPCSKSRELLKLLHSLCLFAYAASGILSGWAAGHPRPSPLPIACLTLTTLNSAQKPESPRTLFKKAVCAVNHCSTT